MYSVYLIDDEPWAIKIIENGFPWTKYDFFILGKSRTVEQALREVPVMKPDVVFTDIRIAGESGIELIRKLSHECVNTIFIIVTGYDDFDIAQAAFKLNVFDLLLKPVDLDEADILLKRLQDQLKKQRLSQQNTILDECKGMSAAAFLQKHTDRSITSPISAIVVRGSSDDRTHSLPIAPLLVLKPAPQQIIYLFEQSVGFERNVLKQLGMLYNGCCIGVSEVATPSTPILLPINHAKMISCQSYITGCNGLFVYNGDHYKSVSKLADELLRENAAFTANELFKIWFTESYHLEDLFYLVCYLSQSSNVLPITGYQDLLNSYDNAHALAQQLLNDLSIQKAAPYQGDKNQIYYQLLQMIHDRFTQDISLSQLAFEMNISASYLSEIFSQQQGISFSKYLKHLRNARACDLLQGTRFSIQDIAELSGFNDYFYFCKQFKNEFGVTPKQYRSQKTDNHF